MEYRILGPLQVVEDGRPITLERKRLRALLGFFLLHANELVTSDRLVDEVWGPDPPKTASASLQNHISRLRKAVGAEAVVSQQSGYVFRVDPEQFDLSRFSAAVRCAAAAMIGTGATNPVIWAWFSRLEGWTGSWWGAASASEASVVLVEMLFYAAALRGHWRWSLTLSIVANAAAFGFLLAPGLPRPN